MKWTMRRTVRRYSDKTVDDELLRELLYKATYAPTTGNMQLYSVIVSRSEDEKRALAPCHFNQPQVMGCSVVLTFCADLNRFTRWCQERKADPCYDNVQSLTAAVLDTMCVAQQFNTIAEDAGLGCCMLGTTTYNAAEIAQTLKLPRLVVPIITITVGYPAEQPDDCGRLPIDAILHEGEYHNYGANDIDRLYADKELREDSQRFVQENGKETLAQVFTDIRYPRANNLLFSDKFVTFIREAGFEI